MKRRGSFSPWLPDPIALATGAAEPVPDHTDLWLGMLWIPGAFVFHVYALQSAWMPFAAVLFVHHSLHLGRSLEHRDSLGPALMTLPFAYAAAGAALQIRDVQPLSLFALIPVSMFAVFLELFLRADSRRYLRMRLARLLGKTALCVAFVATCLGAVLIVAGHITPPMLWLVASVLGLAACLWVLRAHASSFRLLARPAEWRSARRTADGTIEEAPGSEGSVVTLVPRERRAPGGAAYRDVETQEPLVVPGHPEVLQIAAWDVEAALWSFVTIVAPLTSAPLIAVIIWRRAS